MEKKNHLKPHDSKIGKIKIRITSCDMDGAAAVAERMAV